MKTGGAKTIPPGAAEGEFIICSINQAVMVIADNKNPGDFLCFLGEEGQFRGKVIKLLSRISSQNGFSEWVACY